MFYEQLPVPWFVNLFLPNEPLKMDTTVEEHRLKLLFKKSYYTRTLKNIYYIYIYIFIWEADLQKIVKS